MIAIVVSTLAAASLVFSARWTWWRKRAPGLAVLCYHRIGIPPPGSGLKSLWVSPEKFRSQIKYLADNGYKTLLFSEVSAAAASRAGLPEKAVLITFDDGYENNYTEAWPVLREFGAKGNIFVVFNTVGKANLWHNPATEPWINMATPEMLDEMQKSGLVEIGSHAMSHTRLDSLEPENAAWEIRESKKQLEKLLGVKICAFAYPYGAGADTPSLRGEVRKAGYSLDFSFTQGKTVWPWSAEEGPLKRLFIRGGDNNLDFLLHLTRGASRVF